MTARFEEEKPPVATIFVSDPSAEAERVAQALRAEGFLVVDVPLSMLVSRSAVQRPKVVLVDADAEGVLDELKKLRELVDGAAIQIVFLGLSNGAIKDDADATAKGGTAFFVRPLDVPAIVRRASALAGGPPPAAPRPSSPPPSIPSSRQASGSLPPASMRDVGPHSPPPNRPSGLPPVIVPAAPPAAQIELPKRPSTTQGPLSPELEHLLAEAESRVGGQIAPDSLFPSPEDEIEAVLPAEVLESLDEPLEDEEEDEVELAFGGQNRPTTSGGSRQATTGTGRRVGGTGVGTGAGTGVGTGVGTGAGKVDTRPPEPPRRPQSEAPVHTHHGTFAGTTGGRLATELAGASVVPRADTSIRAEPATPQLGASSIPSPVPPPLPVAPPMTPDRARMATVPPPTAAQPPPFSVQSEQRMSSPPVPSIDQMPSTGPHPGDSSARGGAASPAIVPVLLGAGDAPRVVAQAIASRATGALCFESPDGVRRAVLREGDLVTAASGVDGESLLAFLGARGELPRDQIERLTGKLPPFGRHAGAALVAHGHLRQDQLWPVLRAHAEWLLGAMLLLEHGTVQLEAEPPGRLKGEPSVFGGATGSEVFVEVIRRVISPDVAIERLGGLSARIGDGPNGALLAECALGPRDADMIARARGASLRELVERAPDSDVAPVLYALVLLGVCEMIRAVSDDRAPASADGSSASVEALDEDALRARVRARLQLIEEGDYFEVLGIPRTATGYEVRRAFLELRRAFEPARILTPRLADLGTDVKKIVTVLDEAYEILIDAARRERYRRAIEGRP